jgi:hypothetical protein
MSQGNFSFEFFKNDYLHCAVMNFIIKSIIPIETKLKETQRNKINSTKIKAYLNKIFDLNDHIFSCYISHSLGVMIDILNIMASIVTIIMDENHL